jgi:tetratricopeptide (TPR) repeat protein
LAWLLGILVALFLALVIWYRVSTNVKPPQPDDPAGYEFSRTTVSDSVYTSQHGWLRHAREGIWELYLEGDPFTRGYTNGLLTQELIVKQEVAFIDEIRRMIPSESYLKSLRYFIAIFNRNLPEYVPMEYQKEIAGISSFASEEYDFIGGPYLRILNYHAAHDIGHALQNMNLVACTAFGAWDEASADSSMVIGRNFDFYVGDEFAEEKIIMFVNPDEGYAFMSITWGGFIGVVSGMNEQGLTVTLNAAKSAIPFTARTPVSILAREILQYAANIDEAMEIAQRHRTFVSESFLIGSAADGRAKLIEKTPDETVLFDPDTNYIAVTNHFQAEAFQEDELNRENMANGTSVYRFHRTEQLLEKNRPLDVHKSATILRDYRGMDGENIGLGNEKAVNQFIAHHSVIFKPEELKVWVAVPPYQLGEYVCYDLKKVLVEGLRCHLNIMLNDSEESIPADTFIQGAVYQNLIRYRALGEMFLGLDRDDISHKSDDISDAADSLIKYNPEFFMTYRILGDHYHELGQTDKANIYYRIALEKEPPSEAERRYVSEKLGY